MNPNGKQEVRYPADWSAYIDWLAQSGADEHTGPSYSNYKRHLDSSTIASASEIKAWYDSPEPPEPDPPYEYDTEEDFVEIVFDTVVELDGKGNWESPGNDYSWAGDESTKSGDWVSYEHNIDLGDPVSMAERIDELIPEGTFSNLPAGEYRITGEATLVFEISGVVGYRNYYGPDEDGDAVYDEEIDTDYADVEYIKEKSKLENFTITPAGIE